MPKTVIGHPVNLDTPLIGVAAKEQPPIHHRRTHIYVGPSENAKGGYKAYITTDDKILGTLLGKYSPRIILSSPSSYEEIHHGDILRIGADGQIKIVWAKRAKSNALFLTSACNCHCIMCPQPPERHSKEQLKINKKIVGLLGDDVEEICLTGGEPTLFMDEFLEILKSCNQRFPTVPLTVLSNGIRLANLDIVKDIARVRGRLIKFCVPLYSDIDDFHDEITGNANSFYQTIQGIQNLALLRIPTEIRFVITRMNSDRLSKFAEFVYRNFPFVVHVAYMGCEMTGFAQDNSGRVWIDPAEYADALADAVRILETRGVHVSVYNHQLCILSGAAKRNARQSISEWKNIYLPICSGCQLKRECGGFFETSGGYVSQSIAPISEGT